MLPAKKTLVPKSFILACLCIRPQSGWSRTEEEVLARSIRFLMASFPATKRDAALDRLAGRLRDGMDFKERHAVIRNVFTGLGLE
jgi:hypothetical protein